MENNLKERNIAEMIILQIVTFGIYYIVALLKMASELRAEITRQNLKNELAPPLTAFFLMLITLGLYRLYYNYKQALVIEELAQKEGLMVEEPFLVVFIDIFVSGGPIVNANNVNQVIRKAKMNETAPNFFM